MTIEKALELINNYDSVYLTRDMFNGIVKALYQAVELCTGDDDDICSFNITKHSATEYTLSIAFCCYPIGYSGTNFTIHDDDQDSE